MTDLYKITSVQEWTDAVSAGTFKGSALDLRDGFIHLSSAGQVRETARLHFSGQHNLLLVAVPEDALMGTLKWEPSRGGTLFPHVYAALDPAQISWAKELIWDGVHHIFPAELAA